MPTPKRFAFLATLAMLTTLAGCELEPSEDDSTFRGGDYWAEIQCKNGRCWGAHPMAIDDDLWAKLITAEQLDQLVESGRYIEDAAGVGFGYGSCAAGDLPSTMPVVHCWTINGTQINRCYGGDGYYFTEIRAACEKVPGFAAANTDYAPGSCDAMPPMPWAVFDGMMGHNTKMNITRVAWDGDSFMLYPGCAI